MIDRYSDLMRTIEMEIGTYSLQTFMLDALRDTVNAYEGNSMENFCEQMNAIINIVTSTQPKFSSIIDCYFTFRDHALHVQEKHPGCFCEQKQYLLEGLAAIQSKSEEDYLKLLHQTKHLNFNGKNILIHDHSTSVQDTLWTLKKNGQHFRVIVAEQDSEKTLNIIETLTRRSIPFHTVPAYMISNIEDDIDVCLFGCLTLKNTYDFVVDTGTTAIVTQCHMRKIPIYVVLTTSKFALWDATTKDVNQVKHTRKHPWKDITFERLKFSHDRIPLTDVDWVLTEKGIHSHDELRSLYDSHFKKRKLQEQSMKEEESK